MWIGSFFGGQVEQTSTAAESVGGNKTEKVERIPEFGQYKGIGQLVAEETKKREKRQRRPRTGVGLRPRRGGEVGKWAGCMRVPKWV
jgi:DNA-binding protein H-NS